MDFLVTVIIPVYNGAKFIEKALKSALSQQEVLEIIVINDGSSDATESIVNIIAKEDKRVILTHHENKQNSGRSASRNLGIKLASFEYIAFLDADDYYLKNRFKLDKRLFLSNNEIDGVYNSIGVHFYREYTAEEFNVLKLYMVSEEIPSDLLFKNLITGSRGHFSIAGLTLKKVIFEDVGFFNEDLAVAEDTELMWRISLNHNLVTGSLKDPVAKRGVHEVNIFDNQQAYKDQLLNVCDQLFFWIAENKAPKEKLDLLLKILWNYRYRNDTEMRDHIIYWSKQFLSHPKLLMSSLSIKYFPLVRRRRELFPSLYKT